MKGFSARASRIGLDIVRDVPDFAQQGWEAISEADLERLKADAEANDLPLLAFMLEMALAEARALGYAVDDGEQELGVRCVAVPLPGLPFLAAISVSDGGSHSNVITVSRTYGS